MNKPTQPEKEVDHDGVGSPWQNSDSADSKGEDNQLVAIELLTDGVLSSYHNLSV
ncbi:hypothetical protein [Motilimonas eburnea]|uniref:hypothetical protein n=1 Tax=Motilimonas eburnea TaxID=1737488 RepID=UPI001E3B0AAB|nr:hypothetical protein [Motilimonas eburnea]MCE2571689.1 hypothetical protein [Motilimonas eburnea]